MNGTLPLPSFCCCLSQECIVIEGVIQLAEGALRAHFSQYGQIKQIVPLRQVTDQPKRRGKGQPTKQVNDKPNTIVAHFASSQEAKAAYEAGLNMEQGGMSIVGQGGVSKHVIEDVQVVVKSIVDEHLQVPKVLYFVWSDPENDCDVTERAQGYTLQDASFMRQSLCSFLNV